MEESSFRNKGEGTIKYNVPYLDKDEKQTVEKSQATGQCGTLLGRVTSTMDEDGTVRVRFQEMPKKERTIFVRYWEKIQGLPK